MTAISLILTATVPLVLLLRAVERRKGVSAAATGSSSFLPGCAVTFWSMNPDDRRLPTHIATFTSPDGHRYGFTFVRLSDGRCRAYIREQPAYGIQRRDLVSTHRQRDPLGRLYVCFQPEPQEPDQLLTIAGCWISGTDSYVRSGEFSVPEQLRSDHV